ncbi:MAG: aspartate dehydrogenase [Candidatus Omnitrophica bacterium]|nr:aspartate dehydrogenase [Candidatus Omnitrophota bacterium]
MQKLKLIKVGIIGCGTIGSQIAKACQDKLNDKFELVAICDIDEDKARNLKNLLDKKVSILRTEDLIKKVDLVVEAASAKASSEIIERCIKMRRDVFIMSIGGLLGKESLLRSVSKSRVYLPSGALCGLDGLKSASTGKISSVTLTTRKPPKGLAGAPYLMEKGLELSKIDKETVIFDGTAEGAVKGFPQNVNVAAILSLAGIGAERTRVRIVTSPDYTKNVHEVEISGDFGRIMTKTENVPSTANPKTSQMAIFSAIATLKEIADSVKIGT